MNKIKKYLTEKEFEKSYILAWKERKKQEKKFGSYPIFNLKELKEIKKGIKRYFRK